MLKLSICVDCMHMAVNGECQPNPDKEPLSAIDYLIVVDTDTEPYFSTNSCDGCNSYLDGDRWQAVQIIRKPTVDLFIAPIGESWMVWDIRYINPEIHPQSYFTPTQDNQQMMIGVSHFWTKQAATDYCTAVHKDYDRYYNEFVSITYL